MGAMNFITKSLHPLRSHVVADSATKSPFQIFFENALGKTRKFLRVFCRKRNEIASDSYRYQHRLPVEYFPKRPQSTFTSKSKFLSYRPGFIQEVTSKWVTNSLAASLGKETRKKVFQGARGTMVCFVGFGLVKKPSLLKHEEEFEGVSYEIRESFSSIPWQKVDGERHIISAFNEKFKFTDLKIGEMIAKGCNAAVYSAALAEQTSTESIDSVKISSEVISENQPVLNTKLFISHLEGEQNYEKNILNENVYPLNKEENWKNFNLAVKVMFNYNAESNAYAIWRAMYKETLPARMEFSLGEINWHKARKKLKPHPNIVEMHFVFADQLPLLPGAFTNYPQALPVRLLSDGCGRNMTLFLVMKRYHCSLKEYLKTHDISAHTALLLFTQLLEALVHLLQNEIAHRDLKTDNILLDLSDGVEFPKLAITDFGCCLESLQLSYQSCETEKGGNMALMAPEVVTAESGPFSVINYSRSDLWTAGTLAYEIFGGFNPFYSTKPNLKNYDYDENCLPNLPTKASSPLQKLVKDILHVNPVQRPSPNFAATVCQVLLHGPPDISKCSSPAELHQSVLDWMFLMSAETYLEASLHSTEAKPVELELKHTFCSRIQYLDVLKAVKYIGNG